MGRLYVRKAQGIPDEAAPVRSATAEAHQELLIARLLHCLRILANSNHPTACSDFSDLRAVRVAAVFEEGRYLTLWSSEVPREDREHGLSSGLGGLYS